MERRTSVGAVLAVAAVAAVLFLVTAAFGSDGGTLSKTFPWQASRALRSPLRRDSL